MPTSHNAFTDQVNVSKKMFLSLSFFYYSFTPEKRFPKSLFHFTPSSSPQQAGGLAITFELFISLKSRGKTCLHLYIEQEYATE